MSEKHFRLQILSPTKEVLDCRVSDVILPAYDGESGVLPEHENFVGNLGTGALKYVIDGDDHWCMVSSGIFEVSNGDVKILTESATLPDDVNTEVESQKITEIDSKLEGLSSFNAEFEFLKKQRDQSLARLDAHKRNNLVN